MSNDLGMLVLTMRPSERVMLRDSGGRLLAALTVVRTSTGRMKLGIAAPKDVGIGREKQSGDIQAAGQPRKLVAKSVTRIPL